MSIKFGTYDFEGPYQSARQMFEKPGVYIVLCRDIKVDARFYLLDIQESEKVLTHATTSKNMVCWTKGCHGIGTIAVAVCYMEKSTKQERDKAVNYLRALYDVPCK
jgi:hypothetical protein